MRDPDPPIQPSMPLINTKIEAPPKVKVVLLLDKTTELEAELIKGWKIAAHYPHAQGAIFLLLK